MIQLAVRSTADFVTHGWFQIDQNGTRYVFAGRCFTEKGRRRIIDTIVLFDGAFGTIHFNAVFHAVQLPTRVTGLDSGLTQMNRNAF